MRVDKERRKDALMICREGKSQADQLHAFFIQCAISPSNPKPSITEGRSDAEIQNWLCRINGNGESPCF